jgi:hypothetical protein
MIVVVDIFCEVAAGCTNLLLRHIFFAGSIVWRVKPDNRRINTMKSHEAS